MLPRSRGSGYAISDVRGLTAAFGDEVYARMMTADRSGDETNYLYGKAAENAMHIKSETSRVKSRVGEIRNQQTVADPS